MTLYTVTWTARPTPYHHERIYCQWFKSKDDANRLKHSVDLRYARPEVAQVTVPTDKAGLIAFLNSQYEPRRVEK